MSRFTEELRVIPKAAWIVGWLAYFCLAIGLGVAFTVGNDPGIQRMPIALKVILPLLPGLILVAYVALIGYVSGDSKRRGMRHVMWTLLAIFIPDAIGIILYFILRDPMPKPCPGCSTLVKAGFTFCPNCGSSLQPTCPNCGRGVEGAWANCGYCGTKLPSASHRTA
jgi:RNA polymerase subunit RPABC4/transcription elongation factor Spt4